MVVFSLSNEKYRWAVGPGSLDSQIHSFREGYMQDSGNETFAMLRGKSSRKFEADEESSLSRRGVDEIGRSFQDKDNGTPECQLMPENYSLLNP
jgi:hypothetical protein